MKPRAIDRTLPRFLVVGGGLALVYATLAALATSHLPLPKALASGMVWVLCIPLGFWCHRRFTFTTRTPHRHGLWLYAATQGLGIGIAALSVLRPGQRTYLEKPSLPRTSIASLSRTR